MTKDIRNLVDGIAERVVPEDLTSTEYGAEHLARYLFAAHWAHGHRVVDLCCGTGYGTSLLSGAGAIVARGIDVDGPTIADATHRFGRPGVEFSVGDATGELDLADAQVRVCFEGLEHVTDADALLRNMSRGLPAEGVAIVSTPNADLHPSGHSGNPHHVREYSLTDFHELLQPHFASVRMFFQWRYPDPHDVDWSMAQVVRALVPVRVKHLFRRRRRSPATAGVEAQRSLAAADYRPLPVTHLKLPPGLRYGKPSIWIAVCQKRA